MQCTVLPKELLRLLLSNRIRGILQLRQDINWSTLGGKRESTDSNLSI